MKHIRFRPYFLLLVAAGVSGGCGYRSSRDPAKSDKGATSADLKFEFKTFPRAAIAGEKTMWDLKILTRETGRGLKSFADQNGQRLRLAVVSQDLNEFQLIQPEYKDYGHFVTQQTVKTPGIHRVFAVFTPFGGKQVVQSAPFKVGASEGLSAIQREPRLVPDAVREGRVEKSTGDYRLALQTATLRPNATTNLSLILRDKNGVPIRETPPVLGAPVQIVAVSGDGQTLVAPQLIAGTGVGGAPFVFSTVFPRTGLYKVWVQVAPQGKTISVPFVVRVEGKA
ncbi:MAG TPA: hypothetical protein VF681_08395 [Abditibacteriaceae bacterium]|jgi:hypothetical protein